VIIQFACFYSRGKQPYRNKAVKGFGNTCGSEVLKRRTTPQVNLSSPGAETMLRFRWHILISPFVTRWKFCVKSFVLETKLSGMFGGSAKSGENPSQNAFALDWKSTSPVIGGIGFFSSGSSSKLYPGQRFQAY
jgi:hypothetical protein